MERQSFRKSSPQIILILKRYYFAKLNTKGQKVIELLFEAAKKGDASAIEALSQNPDFNVNVKNKNGHTPLMVAAAFGHVDAIKKLLEKKANVKMRDNNNTSAMHFAARSGNIEIMKILTSQGLDYTSPNGEGITTLHYGVASNNQDAVTFLLSQQVDVNAKNNEGNTPLHIAAEKNNVDIISILSQHGAIIDEINDDGDTPIHIAMAMNHVDSVDGLIKAGSQIDVKSYSLYRMCANILNTPVLDYCVKNFDSADYANGGYISEAQRTIKIFLLSYIAEKNLDKTKFQSILDSLDLVADEEIIKDPLGKSFFSYTGCKGHTFYYSVKNKFTHYKLSFAERGLFAKENNGKTQPFFSLSVPKDQLEPTLNYLFKAKDVSEAEAKKIIFDEIPKMVGEQYQYDAMKKKKFKRGRCYFENLKSLINKEFVDLFGEKDGNDTHKEFVLFMEKKAIAILKNLRLDRKEIAINHLTGILDAKVDKLDPTQRNTFLRSL